MSNSNTLLIEIICAIDRLGGEATLESIYEEIRYRNKIDPAKYIDFNSRIRTTIYKHSSDTDIFLKKTGSKNDFFYSVEGKGNGIWGLRWYINEMICEIERIRFAFKINN